MIYFKMEIGINGFVAEVDEGGAEEKDNVIGTRVNQALGHLNEEKFSVSAFLTMLDKEEAEVMFSKQAEDPLEQVSNKILNKIKTLLNVSGTIERVEEITAEKFRNGISESSEKGYMRGSRHTINELKLDFDDNYTFDIKEGIVPQKKISRKKALDKAFALMGDEEYRKEIDRIYSKENLKKFFCHPVHYYICAENQESADEMTELLLQSLFNNGRLLGRRVSHVLELKQNCYDERDFENMISSSQGATVVISMNVEREKDADISSDYENVINYVAKMVKKYHQNVLFVFQEIIEGASFGKVELTEILELMIKQKGYECEPDALEKCQQIFEKASQEDDFGNGRFARNLLERAIMRQSSRIIKEYIGMEINEKQISLLTADDFQEPDEVKENTDYRIGFRCA